MLACDLGSTSFRAALVDPDGRIVGLASRPTEIGSEFDPEIWWTLLCDAAEELVRDRDLERVAAVAISGLTRTQVFLDKDLQPLWPAITWADARAESVMPEVRRLLPAAHPEAAQLTAFHPLARLAWLAKHEPNIVGAVAAVVEPKDYLNLRLTGECRIDPIGSARLIAATAGADGEAALKALGLSASIVPPAIDPGATVGRVRNGLAGARARLAGRPVIQLGNDTWTSVVGLGALRDGYAYNLSGTTEVLGVVSRTKAITEGLMTVDWGGGLTQIGGPSQNGADTLVWLADLLGQHKDGPALETLLGGEREPQPLLFLPYLQGERVPYWDPHLRGAFVGLNRRHGATDCGYAVLEGIAFLNRLVLERAEAAVGRRVTEIRFGGGGAANAVWCQIKADICGRTITVAEDAEPGILGAAIIAFTALGQFPDFAIGQDKLVRIRRRFEPRAALSRRYDRLYSLYGEAEAALAPISRKLAQFPHDELS